GLARGPWRSDGGTVDRRTGLGNVRGRGGSRASETARGVANRKRMKPGSEGAGAELSPLKRALVAIESLQAELAARDRAAREPIAVIGIGCRFPGGVRGPEELWNLVRRGEDAITEIPEDRWPVARLYDPDPEKEGKVCTRWGGFLDELDRFDPEFFGISPREAAGMDPQQRLLLEVAWEALEHAGEGPANLGRTRTGVFVGIVGDDFAGLYRQSRDLARFDAHVASGIARSVGAGRISYVLGLEGPAVTVDTACSSSL